jgi:hypothetical protein
VALVAGEVVERITACPIKGAIGLEQVSTALGADAVVILGGFFVALNAVNNAQTANEKEDDEGEACDCFKGLGHGVYLLSFSK